MPTRTVRALAVVLVAVLLGGCASFVPPADPGGQVGFVEQIKAIEGGECFRILSVQGMTGVDFANPVSCAEDHEVEILRTVMLPTPLAEKSVEDIQKLAWPGGEVYEHVMPSCLRALGEWTGVVERIGGLPGLDGDIGLAPAVSGALQMTLVPASVWDEHPAVFCTFQPLDGSGQVVSVSSPVDEPVVSTFGRASAPDELRLCMEYGDVEVGSIDCARPHHAEVLFEFDAVRYFGEKWVSGVDPFDPSDEVWADVDGACGVAAQAVFGAVRTRDDVVIQGDLLGGEWYGPAEGEGLLHINAYPIACTVIVTDPTTLLDGTVWGIGDAPAPLVPTG